MIGPLDEGEKCGTIEKVFDVLKNDLGGGVMPFQTPHRTAVAASVFIVPTRVRGEGSSF